MAVFAPASTTSASAEFLAWLPQWIISLGLFVVAVAGALTVHVFLERMLCRLTAERRPALYRTIKRTGNLTRLALVLMALHVVLPSLLLAPAWEAHAHNALFAAFVLLMGWVVLVGINIAADRYVARFRMDVADNLLARKFHTQIKVLRRLATGVVVLVSLAVALMVFPAVRDFGISLFASAGVAGIIAGLAARPVLENLLAGVQIALTQPIRLDDVVIVEGEWGRVEEINSAYVVVKIWDLRRLVVPLSWFITNPFQNWTRTSATVIGTVLLHLDYTAPVAALRSEAENIVRGSKLWDGDVFNVQVTDATPFTIEFRVLATARNSPEAFDLRCEIREKLIDFVQREYPQALPRARNDQRAIKPDIAYPPHPAAPRSRARADVPG
jgi:small-conductance mechanosensitive channel